MFHTKKIFQGSVHLVGILCLGMALSLTSGTGIVFANSSSSNAVAPADNYSVHNLRQDLNINDAQFTNGINLLSAREYLSRLDFFIDSRRQEIMPLAKKQAFVAQLKADLQKFQADGAAGAQLLILFEKGIPYESWEAFKAAGGTLPQFIAAITGDNQDVRKAALLGLVAPGTERDLKLAYLKMIRKVSPDKHAESLKLYYNMRASFINGIYDRPIHFNPGPEPARAAASAVVSDAAFTLDPAEEAAAAAWVPLDESPRRLGIHVAAMVSSLRREPTKNEMVNSIFATMAKPTDEGYADLPEHRKLTKSQIVKILRDDLMVID